MADSNTQNTSSAIGYVKLMSGLVKAVDINGVERNLQIGDTVFADETIVTGPQAAIVIELRDGSNLSMGGESQALLDDEVYDPSVAENVEDNASTIDAIQQAILAGADPTNILDATAAGAGDSGAGDGNQGQVAVERTGAETTPESGFETTGLAFQFDQILDDTGAVIPDASNPPGAGETTTLNITGSASVVEGETATYTVTVDKAPASTLTVNVVTGHITTDNGDLVPVTTAVTIAAGATSATFTVNTLDDAYADSGEQFTASIASTSGGGYENLVVGTSSVTTTILDQTGSDNPPGAEDTTTLNITGTASVVEGETATYTVTVDKAPASTLTVNVVT
ncbi:retention module-containing protein, partial [Sedimenticola selenatireducens]